MAVFGIRREDKNRWERRAPLTPAHVEEVVSSFGLSVALQPSARRIFTDAEYLAAGAELSPALSGCPIVLAIKEIPPAVLRPRRVYLCFAHVIKGQAGNMPALRRFLELGSTLIDYECIADDAGGRLIGFGRYAGYAGMIDALWALGQRLAAEGVASPFAAVGQAWTYAGVEEALRALEAKVGREIRRTGVPPQLHPLIVGFTGGGNVSSGAQEIYDHLPVREITPGELARVGGGGGLSRHALYKVVFRRQDRVDFARHLPYLTVLVNGIYWPAGAPRLVTVADLRSLYAAGSTPRLRVLADLSCDLRGSIEATVRCTTPGEPVYVFDPRTGTESTGVAGHGPVVLAVDNLPAELPRDASQAFGSELLPFLPELAAADFSLPYHQLALPPALHRAVIAHGGRLAPRFEYLEEPLTRHVA